jgi:[ribosomal protein S5]-alanine N-acetyltransferase
MTTGVSITTARFVLRELTVDDVSSRYLSWFSDAAAAKYIGAAGHTKQLQDLRDYVQERTGRDDVLFLGIFDAATGAHVGNIKYQPVDPNAGYAIMGVLIGEPEFRGKGVTPEVLTASARWLQAHRGIRQILLGVHTENTAAVRAYERVGFVIEDTPHISGPRPGSLTMTWHL